MKKIALAVSIVFLISTLSGCSVLFNPEPEETASELEESYENVERSNLNPHEMGGDTDSIHLHEDVEGGYDPAFNDSDDEEWELTYDHNGDPIHIIPDLDEYEDYGNGEYYYDSSYSTATELAGTRWRNISDGGVFEVNEDGLITNIDFKTSKVAIGNPRVYLETANNTMMFTNVWDMDYSYFMTGYTDNDKRHLEISSGWHNYDFVLGSEEEDPYSLVGDWQNGTSLELALTEGGSGYFVVYGNRFDIYFWTSEVDSKESVDEILKDISTGHLYFTAVDYSRADYKIRGDLMTIWMSDGSSKMYERIR